MKQVACCQQLMLKPESEAIAMNWLYNQLATEILAPASESEAKRSHDSKTICINGLYRNREKQSHGAYLPLNQAVTVILTLFFAKSTPMAESLSISNSGAGAESDRRFKSARPSGRQNRARVETQSIYMKAAMSFSFIAMKAVANNPIAELKLKNDTRESQLKRHERVIFPSQPRKGNRDKGNIDPDFSARGWKGGASPPPKSRPLPQFVLRPAQIAVASCAGRPTQEHPERPSNGGAKAPSFQRRW